MTCYYKTDNNKARFSLSGPYYYSMKNADLYQLCEPIKKVYIINLIYTRKKLLNESLLPGWSFFLQLTKSGTFCHLLYPASYCRNSIAFARYTNGAFQLIAISLEANAQSVSI